MTMEAIRKSFRERCREIGRYLAFVRFVEVSGSDVVSRDRSRQFPIDQTTTHVLKASVFVHLYNLVESVVTNCLARVAQEIHDNKLTYGDINREWQACYVRELARTQDPMNQETRLRALLIVCDRLLGNLPVTVTPKRKSGSLDDAEIADLLKDHGMHLKLSRSLEIAVKRHVVDKNGPLKLVRHRRNDLAHGLASFGDCGRNVSAADLRRWAAIVFVYLREIINQFDRHIAEGGFKSSKTG
jgi:hypothetical protein